MRQYECQKCGKPHDKLFSVWEQAYAIGDMTFRVVVCSKCGDELGAIFTKAKTRLRTELEKWGAKGVVTR